MSFMTPPHPGDLRELQRRGGRMLIYHGASDPIFSPDDTARWFRSLGHHDGQARDDHGRGEPARSFARLFLVPGMNHCSGGPATDQFDLLGPLVRWVEDGDAPEHVVATARGAGNAGGVNLEVPTSWAPNRTRPLCAYPKVATYHGGDPERAVSFSCR
jgi:feruloyl esterase